MLIDTHCHLTANRFQDDADAVVEAAKSSGIGHMITIGTGLADADAGRVLAERHPGVISRSAGLDPFTCYERRDHLEQDLKDLEVHLRDTGCVALGECGLEYFHQDNILPHDQQATWFEAQLQVAQRLHLPVVIHVRDAHKDMLAILRNNPKSRGVIHSFDGESDVCTQYLDLGWYISLNGMVTFKRNDYLREAAKVVPDDRLLVETDSPYLAPVPLRGKRCEPAFVQHTAALLAELRGTTPSHIAEVTTANAKTLFGLSVL